MRSLLVIACLLFATAANAAVGTVYVDTAGTNGALATNSGTSDTTTPLASGTAATWTTCTGDPCTITLDTNTNIGTVPGCAAGTCDGSHAIFLTNSTASNQKIFWIGSYTGCTGVGACTVTLLPKGTGTGNNINWATCSTCTAQVWAIGGRYLWPATNVGETTIVGSLRPGDTVQFNTSPAAKSTAVFSAQNNGDTVTGKINIIGKTGVLPVLTTSSGIVLSLGAKTNYYISNLSLSSTTGTGGVAINAPGSGTVINGVTITGTGSGACINIAVANVTVMNSNITGCTTSGITSASGPNLIFGNYIHATTGDCITISGTSAFSIINNILYICGGRGVYDSASPSITSNPLIMTGNTVYMTGANAALEITAAATPGQLFNNIFYNNSGNAATWDAGIAEAVFAHNYNVFFGTLSGVTLNSTEISTDPQFIGVASGNFNLSPGSPALNIAFPGTITGLAVGGSKSPGAMGPAVTIGGGGNIIGG